MLLLFDEALNLKLCLDIDFLCSVDIWTFRDGDSIDMNTSIKFKPNRFYFSSSFNTVHLTGSLIRYESLKMYLSRRFIAYN